MVDKTLLIIVIFLSITILMAAILAMGAIPQIFRSAEKINQTQEIINQTQIQLHEDEAREKQVTQILNQVKVIITEHHDELENYVDRQNNTTRKLLINQENMIHGIELLLNTTVTKISDNQLKVTKYGTENNAIGRAIAKELGLNITEVLDEYYTENNMTPIYPPPPPPVPTDKK
jgi:type II secretory pathway pseudopilin PulG